jgi:L-ascorbate metabolism protein UlaG (beta-lactamase superfamily)
VRLPLGEARTAARHLGAIAAGAISRGPTATDDADALRELERAPVELPPGLELEWLGVSGYRMTFEGKTLFIDPYFSRVPLSSLLRRRPAVPQAAVIDRHLNAPGEVVGVLVGHTHFDHAVDAPALAKRFGCPAYGSRSLVNLMALHGIAEQGVEVEPYRTYEVGPFAVTFVPSVHSKLILGVAVPFAGELTCDHFDGLVPSAYRCGQVWGIHIEVAGATFYHQGSADLIDEAIRHRGVDYFLAGIAGRNFTEDYWSRILRRLEPRVVVPTHYDDFFKPLDESLEFVGNVNLAGFTDEIAAVSGDFEIAALPRLGAGGGGSARAAGSGEGQ